MDKQRDSLLITNEIYKTGFKSPLCEGLRFFFLQTENRLATNSTLVIVLKY